MDSVENCDSYGDSTGNHYRFKCRRNVYITQHHVGLETGVKKCSHLGSEHTHSHIRQIVAEVVSTEAFPSKLEWRSGLKERDSVFHTMTCQSFVTLDPICRQGWQLWCGPLRGSVAGGFTFQSLLTLDGQNEKNCDFMTTIRYIIG